MARSSQNHSCAKFFLIGKKSISKVGIILFIFLIGFIFINNVSAPSSPEGHNISGNSVSWENDFGSIRVWEHTSKGLTLQIQYINLTWKKQPTNLDFAFELDETNNQKMKNKRAYLWRNFSHPKTKCYSCEFNITDCGFGINYNESNCSVKEIIGQNCEKCGSYIEDNYYYDWKDTSNLLEHTIYNNNHYYFIKDVPFEQDETKQAKIEYETPPNTHGKWSLFVKRNQDTIQEALSSGNYVKLDPWWDSNWGKCKNVTITGGVTALTDFTVLLNVSYDSDMAFVDFADIRFINTSCNNDGSELKFEFDKIINSSSTLIWVKIPTLSDISSNTTISIYYDNSGASSGEDSVNAWDNNYIGVWHLTEGTGTTTKDSKQNGNGSLVANTAWVTNETCYIGNCLSFDGSGDYVTMVNDGDFNVGNLTLEIYSKPRCTGTCTDHFASKPYDTGSAWDAPYISYMNHAGNDDAWYTNINYAGTYDANTILESPPDGQYVLTYDSETHNSYLNKALRSSDTGPAGAIAHDGNANFSIGIDSVHKSSPGYFLGYLDEVRISNIARSSAWINRSYDNTDFSLFSFGAEESAPAGDTTAPNVTINTPILTNYTIATINFNITAKDETGMDSCLYSLDLGVTNLTMSNSTVVDDYEATNSTMAQGDHTASFYCDDTSNNWNSTESVSFSVDSVPPLISYEAQSPVDYANLSQDSLYVNVTWTETNFANITFTLKNDTDTVNTTDFTTATYDINWTSLSNLNYTYYVNITDFANNMNSTDIRYATIDTTTPSISYIVPLNSTYNSTTLLNMTINVTDNLGIKNATMYIYNSTNDEINQTTTSFSQYTIHYILGTDFTFPYDNEFTWFYESWDWANNLFAPDSNRTITIDTTNPLLDIIYPSNGDWFNYINVDINYTVSDTNIDSCWWSNDTGQTNNTVTCGTNLTTQDWDEGSNTIYIWINDSAGNVNDSESIIFNIDTVYPLIDFVTPTPTNNTYRPYNSAYINVSITETNNHSAFIDWNNSLVLWIRMNNESGENSTFVKDYSIYGNNGTVDNATLTDSGKYGGAFNFLGLSPPTPDYINAHQDSSLNITTGVFTISAWIKSGIGTQQNQIAGKKDNTLLGTNSYRLLQLSTGIVSLEVANSFPTNYKRLDGTTDLRDNSWHYIVGARNSSGYIFLYIDGVLKNSFDYGSYDLGNIGNFTIGKWGNEYDFNGTIDEVKVFRRILSTEEINATYNGNVYPLYNNFTNLNDGILPYQAHTQDLSGNVNSTETRQITIDTTLPLISITNPTNTTYSTNQTDINYTFTEINCDSVWYSLNKGETNSTRVSCGTNWTGLISTEGYNNWTMWMNDSANNYNSSSISFWKDTNLSGIDLLGPSNLSEDSDGIVDFSFNVTDISNVTNCSLYTNDIWQYTKVGIIVNISQTITEVNPIETDQLRWYISCRDEFSNEGNSTIYYVDTQVGGGSASGGGGGTGAGSFAKSLGIENVSIDICNVTYDYVLEHGTNYYGDIDKIINELKKNNYDLETIKTYNPYDFTTIRTYIDNWQGLCSDLLRVTLEPEFVCNEIFEYYNNTEENSTININELRDKIKTKIPISLDVLTRYVFEYYELCYNQGRSLNIEKEELAIEGIEEKEKDLSYIIWILVILGIIGLLGFVAYQSKNNKWVSLLNGLKKLKKSSSS